MNRIRFIVEKTPESGLVARALCESIFTGADDVGNLYRQVWSAVHCHFEEGRVPQKITLC